MILELLIFLERLSNEELGEWYSRYCMAYELGYDPRGLERVKRNALKNLSETGYFNFHPIRDGVFNITIEKRGIKIQTSSQKNMREKLEGDSYLSLMKEYYKAKEDAVVIRQIE